MHHNHRAFDETDPDAGQALEDAIPIVEELLAERAKPEPRSEDVRVEWIGQIAEIRSRLTGLADRAGCSVNELEKLAEVEIRHRTGKRFAQAPAFSSPTAPDMGFRELASEVAKLELERAGLQEEDRRHVVERNKLAGRISAIGKSIERLERRMRRRGARRLA